MGVSLSETIGIAKKISQQQISIGITNVEFVSPNTLKFTLADASIYNITIPELHTHSNLSDILEKFTVDTNGKLLFDGKLIEGSDATIDLSNYYNKSEVDNLVNGKTDIDDTIISLAKTYSSSKIDTTYVKKEVGKGLFSGSYNDLTDKPQLGITDLSTFTTDDLAESSSKKYVSPTQITDWNNHINNKTNAHEVKMNELMDTNIIAPINNQILVYDVATSKWTNESVFENSTNEDIDKLFI